MSATCHSPKSESTQSAAAAWDAGTSRASPGMKNALVAIVLVTVCAGAEGATHPQLPGAAAPRATDLLRAETLAEQAEKRLRMPARRGPGWLRGGSGWNDGSDAAPAPHDPVIINVHPSRRRAPQP